MARPKRQRSEVASIELPPTTRRRRSSHIEQEVPAVGVGGKADSHKKGTATVTTSNSSSTKAASNENTATTASNTMKNHNASSHDLPAPKKNAATATDDVVGAPTPKSARSQPSTFTSTAAATHTSTNNDPGNDHADDSNDTDGKKKMSQVDANSHMELSAPVISVTQTDDSAKSIMNNMQAKNKNAPSNSTSKVLHTTATINTTNAATTTTGNSTTIARSSTTTTRRSSNLNQNAMRASQPVEPSTISSTSLEVSNTPTVKGENIAKNDTVEASSLIPDTNVETVSTTEQQSTVTTEPKKTKLRKEDIAALLQHRKMLLQRIRQCRKVSEQRLYTDAVRGIDEEKETVIFTDTMKQVLSMARKQARLEQQRDGNNNKNAGSNSNNNNSTGNVATTTVSLRRGNSVGKRMNAAISTLTGTSVGNSNQQQHHGPSDVVPMKLTTLMNTTNDSTNPLSGGLTGTGDMANQYKNVSSTSAGGIIQSSKSVNKRSDSAMSRTIQKKWQNNRGINDNHAAHQQQQQRQRINAVADSGALYNHQSFTSTNSMTGLHHPLQQNRVVCPETMALRNRRDEIRNTLTTLLKSRQYPKLDKIVSLSERRNSLVSHVSSSSLSPRSTVLSSKPIVTSLHRTSRNGIDRNKHKLSSTSALPIWESPEGPPTRPPRRKTHWDTVLEEMTWMATDFIEEQKWKYATARVLSVQVATFVSSSKKKCLPVNSDAKQVRADAVEQSQSSDNRSVGERGMDISHTDNRGAGGSTATVVLPTNFQSMTIDDIKSARNIAKQVSDIITDMFHLNSMSSGQNIANITTLNPNQQANVVFDESGTTEPTLQFSKEKAEFIQRASSHIDHILKSTAENSSTVDEKSKSTEEKRSTNEIQPTTEQRRTMQMIEDRWQRIGIGSVLHGPRSSGKTIVACSLLHRNRSHGPQLLVCSSASLTRWMHELGNFKGLQIKQWNYSDSNAMSMRSFSVNDVVVCRRSSLVNFHLKDLPKFATIVLDCRYAKQSNQCRLNGGRTEQSIYVPNDLSSREWWRNIIELVSTGDIDRRLVVDSFDSDSTLTYLRGLTSKEYLSVTALRTAFLIGPKWFATPIYPIDKAILAWARQSTKQQNIVGSKYAQVSNLLSKICATCQFSTGMETDNVDWLGKFISCDVRYCTMTQSQQLAYNRACQQSRLILSMDLDNQNEKALDDIAACLLLLRRRCFHSDIDSILRNNAELSLADTVRESGYNLSYSYRTPQGNNAAQPDIELGRRILSGSTKLRQLVSILRRNEEYNRFGLSDRIDVGLKKNIDTTASSLVDQKTKIAIIAALPEIQLLVSCLLHSLGINHDVLVTHSSTRPMQNLGYNNNSLPWSKVQALLSKFNDRENSNIHIVIASLVTIEGDHVGLGIESADTIILLDENWSGQDERLLHSMISRCSLKRKLTGRSSVDLIRLVTECTCEETFLRNDTGVQCSADTLLSWYRRHHTIDIVKSSEVNHNIGTPAKMMNGQHDSSFFLFCFPGQNIFRHRNKALDDILRPAQPLSHLHPFSLHHRFLPVMSVGESTYIETKLTSCIMHMENLCRGYGDHLEVLPCTVVDDNQTWYAASNCLPPAPLRNFIRQQFEAVAVHDNGSMLSLTNVTLATKGGSRSLEASDQIERDARSVLSRSPSDVAISMLFYGSYDVDVTTDDAISHRCNRYAASFSTVSSGDLRHDGNQGIEALVYFPPVFPKLREIFDNAIDDIRLKRRHQTPSDELATDESTHPLLLQNEGHHMKTESKDLVTDFGLAGIGLFPSIEDSISAAANIVSQTGTSCVESIDSLNVWLSSISPINAEEYQTTLQHRIADKSIKSVILMVSRKRQRGQSNISYQARYGTGLWNGISSPISEISPSVDVNGVNKKVKKAVSAFNRLPLADTPQHARPTMFTFQRKDDYRHRLLSTLRQSSTSSGSTIFEAPIFRVATVRIRDKISDRLQHQGWTTSSPRVNDKSRSGLPITSQNMHEGDSNSWTSIVSRSHKPATILDDHINERARQQTISFLKSHFEPRRVDFGPFRLGFVASTSGMTFVTYPRARIGVTLPMGVKISIFSKEQTAVQWSDEMDRILATAINRFGTNWILASRLLKSFFGVSYLHKESNFYRIQCAPRNCRDRWRLLTKEEGSNKQNDAKSGTQPTQDVGNICSRKIVSNQNDVESKNGIVEIEFLIPTSIDSIVPAKIVNETLLQRESSPTQCKLSKRKFTAFKLGSAKKQNMPVPITGVASVISPCHPSHELTVQRSTMAVNGRTDMWPLQILDGAERLRTAAAASVVVELSSSNGPSVPSRRPVSMSSRPHISNSNGRSAASSSHRSQSTVTPQVPVQRTTSSSGPSIPHRPTSQHAYPTNHVTASKQRFVPPMPPVKAISTPKVQLPTSHTMQPPQPSKSINTTSNASTQPPSAPTKTAVTVTSNIGGAIVPPATSNGTINTAKAEPSKTLSVPQLSQEMVAKKPTATLTPAVPAKPSDRAESDAPAQGRAVDVKAITDSNIPESAKVANVVTEKSQPIPPSMSTNAVADPTTTTEDFKPVVKPVVPTTEAVSSTIPATPIVQNESTATTE